MKKLLSLILAIVTLLSVATLSAGAKNADLADTGAKYYISDEEYEIITVANSKVYGYIGDVDCDKEITVLDASTAQRAIAQLTTLNNTANLLADVDFDNEISVIDVADIQRYLARYTTESKIAHTLYEITSGTNTGDLAKQLVNYLKANGDYDEDLDWYYIYNYASDYDTGLIYMADDNEIAISVYTYAETSSVDVFLSVNLDEYKEEYEYNTFLASKYVNGEPIYDAFGEAKQLKSTDKKLNLTSHIFDTDTSLAFNDVEAEIQETIAIGFADIEEYLGNSFSGSLYSLFA